MDKIKELVERAINKTESSLFCETKERDTELATQIVMDIFNDPDLALIDREKQKLGKYFIPKGCAPVILLAEAMKEAQDD